MDPESICYLINNEIVNLYPPTDEIREQYRVDHAFAIANIKALVDDQQIRLKGPITRIALLTNEFEEVIYVHTQETDTGNKQVERSNGSNQQSCKPLDSNAGSSQSSSNQTTDLWEDKATRFILDKYFEYMDQIGPMKMFRHKKLMWIKISQEFLEKYKISKTALQIENRFKTVLRRKKDAVNHNAKSGRSRQEVPFEDELQKISSKDDSIEPEVIRSAKNVKFLKRKRSQSTDSDSVAEDEDDEVNKKILKPKKLRDEMPKKRKRQQTSAELIRYLYEEKENTRQKRHSEKIELMRELFGNKGK